MILQTKISRLFYFTVALIGCQTCLCGAEGRLERDYPVNRVFISCELKNNILNDTAKNPLPESGDATLFERDLGISLVTNRVLPAAHDNMAEINSGTIFDQHASVAAIDPEKTLQLGGVIDAVRNKPVIFIGERHANFEDHKVELEIIKGLYKKGRKFAIGMEMFQKPFQKAIDQYLSGAICERKFLKKTEYFKRWVIDYNLYREILEFAKVSGIPILALNQRSEIMKKVAVGGLEVLSAEERREIPQDMDMSDASYKKRLEEVYAHHPHKSTFENFYQSQILWDETMADTAAHFLEQHPDYQVIILAGAEHIMYGSGIPNRLHRLTGKDYVTLINGVFDKSIGTYVLLTLPIEPPFSAKLGVMVREADNRIFVDTFSPDSIALQAGLKEGDIISSINGWKIHNDSDIKIALFDRKPGQTVHITVIRNRFILGAQELDFYLHF